ncbi:hypothetical protein ABW21_db0206183 [Orbilia brochopaga]|nr:hypothetical protein ABW21_db0206183 [Drechslerella brochopaga]
MALPSRFAWQLSPFDEILSPGSTFYYVIDSSKTLGDYCSIEILVFAIAIVAFSHQIAISTIWHSKRRLLQSESHLLESENITTGTYKKQRKRESLTTSYRLLYHELQNAEDHPEAIAIAWRRLIQLFDVTLSKSLQSSGPTILSLPKYNITALTGFLANNEATISAEWTAYLARRTAGGPRELLHTRSYAEHFLRLSAPVKFVDGAWLSRVHHANTAPKFRHISRIAWQILSEELGDGGLAKNHVQVYADLLNSLNIDIGSGDSSQFIDTAVNPGNDPRVWAAAIAQLALGMFPDELFPEILGFNLAYEAVGLDTLICVHELKELKLDATYFNLHVTIDNADSGHTAMSLHAVAELMRTCQSPTEEDAMWRRVQAGYVLAQGLPVHPRPMTPTETAILDIFSAKCGPAKSAHQGCKALIGGRNGMKLGEWMDPETWEKRKYDFLETLASSSWVHPGQPAQSKLVKEVMWKGRMFGAFTASEVSVLEKWIAEIEDADGYEREIEAANGAYSRFVKQNIILRPRKAGMHCTTVNDGVGSMKMIKSGIPSELPERLSVKTAKPWQILFASAMPLQHCLASPAKCATLRGMLILRILRALNGLANIGDMVAGMDEVVRPSAMGVIDLALQVNPKGDAMVLGGEWDWLGAASLVPEKKFWFLVGVQYAFVLLVEDMRTSNILDENVGERVKEIFGKVKQELDTLDFLQREESCQGFWTTLHAVRCEDNFKVRT